MVRNSRNICPHWECFKIIKKIKALIFYLVHCEFLVVIVCSREAVERLLQSLKIVGLEGGFQRVEEEFLALGKLHHSAGGIHVVCERQQEE